MPIRYSNSVTANWADGTPTDRLDDFAALDENTSVRIPAVGTSIYGLAILFDLEEAKDVDAVRLHCNGTTGASNPLFLAYSADGQNWSNTTAPDTLTTTGNWQTVETEISSPTPPVSARFWRVAFSRLGTAGSIELGDCRLYNAGIEVPANPPLTPCTPPAAPVISSAVASLSGNIPRITITGF